MTTKKQWKQLYEQSMLEQAKLIENYNSNFNPAYVIDFNKSAYEDYLITKDIMLCSNRYEWKNIPINLTSQQIEALLYQYGSLCMFENDNGELMITPFAKVGELNFYGQLDKVQPIDLSGKAYDVIRTVISSTTANVPETEKVAIIINDYTSFVQISNELSRYHINKSTTIKDQVFVYSQLLTNMIVSVKKAIALCESEEQRDVITKQAKVLLNPNQPIVAVSTNKDKNGNLELPVQLFNFNNTFDTQNYTQTIEFYDKTRRNYNGIASPDTFEKKERKIVAESEDTNLHTQIILYDGLIQRKNALELFKKYCKNPINKNIEVEINEILLPQIESDYEEVDETNEKEESPNE